MTYGLVVTLDEVDVTCHAFAPLDIAWGREHPGDSFEPRRLTCGFDEVADPQRGQRIVVRLNAPSSNPTWETTPGTWSAQVGTWAATRRSVVLFDGKVTDTTTSWVPVEPHASWAVVVETLAVDPVADLSRYTVGDVPWPQETITQRAQRIEALTPLAWINDTSAALVVARDVDAQPALALLDDLAHMGSLSGGIVYDPNTQRALFALDSRRNSTAPLMVLDACDVLTEADEIESITDVVNDCTVTYRDPADPQAQPSTRYTQPASVDAVGMRSKTISTDLATPADAVERARAEVTRFGVGGTRWESVILTNRTVPSLEMAEQLLAANPGIRLRLTDFPAPAVMPWDGYLEGWAFTGDVDDWQVQLNLSPAVWSGPLLAWADAVRPGAVVLNVNPSFEATPWSVGWSGFWRSSPYVTITPVTTGAAPDGDTYVRVDAGPYGSSFQRLQVVSAIPCTPGQVFHIKATVRTTAASAYVAPFAVCAPPGVNPEYFVPGAVAINGAPQAIPADNVWRTYDLVLPAIPAGMVSMRPDLNVRLDVGGATDVDNVRVFLPQVGAWQDVNPSQRWLDAVSAITWE